jgi:hypothetical protein
MKISTEFNGGIYPKECSFKECSIGSIFCTGHKEMNINPCENLIAVTKTKTVYFSIIKEDVEIIDEIDCSAHSQLKLF